MTAHHKNEASTESIILQANDLPAYCPNPNMPLWSSHPRVFLDFSHSRSTRCPYCGSVYALADGVEIKAH